MNVLFRREDAALQNKMEELTLTVMAQLPTAAMYVMDLSGGADKLCLSVEDLRVLRQRVRERFPRRPWIHVVAKADLGVAARVRERLESTPILLVQFSHYVYLNCRKKIEK